MRLLQTAMVSFLRRSRCQRRRALGASSSSPHAPSSRRRAGPERLAPGSESTGRICWVADEFQIDVYVAVGRKSDGSSGFAPALVLRQVSDCHARRISVGEPPPLVTLSLLERCGQGRLCSLVLSVI